MRESFPEAVHRLANHVTPLSEGDAQQFLQRWPLDACFRLKAPQWLFNCLLFIIAAFNAGVVTSSASYCQTSSSPLMLLCMPQGS
jgi:hypothetical protein